jgi:hypothetical protein
MKRLLLILLIAPALSYAQKDTMFWNHIYHPYRLQIIKPDTIISGKVVRIIDEEDGDYHVYVQTSTTKLNVEIICYHPEKKTACNGYSNKITIPHYGDNITLIGDYVYDMYHKWYEIHPVKKLIVVNPPKSKNHVN